MYQKAPGTLEAQLLRANAELGVELLPDSLRRGRSVFELGPESLRAQLSVRYELYDRALRRLPVDEKEIRFVKALNGLSDGVALELSESGILRPKQRSIFQAIHDAFEQGAHSGWIKVPTAVGKTVVYSQIARRMGLS